MKCPYCGSLNSKVMDSRLTSGEFAIRRRRECQNCMQRFTTYEKIEELPVVIVKKDGRREDFNRKKIFKGIKKACEKRTISTDKIEEIVDLIERDLRGGNDKEISSKAIGEKIMERLHALDGVAYVRFASVYREFKDIGDFMEELKSLIPSRESDPEQSDNE